MAENDSNLNGSERIAEIRIGRRRLLEALTLASGALAASALLPNEWVKPVATQGALPSQDDTSPVLGTGDLQVTVTWDTDESDIDTFVIEPTGEVVWYLNLSGPTATLDFDNTEGFGPENVFVPAGGAAPGIYKVYVGFYDWDGDGPAPAITVTIRITVFDGTPAMEQETFTRVLTVPDYNATVFAVADIGFPAGTICEMMGSIPRPAAAAAGMSK